MPARKRAMSSAEAVALAVGETGCALGTVDAGFGGLVIAVGEVAGAGTAGGLEITGVARRISCAWRMAVSEIQMRNMRRVFMNYFEDASAWYFLKSVSLMATTLPFG